jgi:hypothetical protein
MTQEISDGHKRLVALEKERGGEGGEGGGGDAAGKRGSGRRGRDN